MSWPSRYEIFGVRVSATDYDELLQAVVGAARDRRPATVAHMPVHGLVLASRAPDLRRVLNGFEIVAPDGQPVRWALNRLHGTELADRVYGPEFMLRLCESAAEEKLGVYLLGGRPRVLELLRENLIRRFPELRIVGYRSPPFRELTDGEFREIAEEIEASRADVVFLGLGCPKQERYADRLRREGTRAVQVCVGAAFDFHAGVKPMAPVWMQRRGLEWLFRLCVEPGRLWRRYLFTNSVFLAKYARCRTRRLLTPR